MAAACASGTAQIAINSAAGAATACASFFPVPLFQLVLKRVFELSAIASFGLALINGQAPRAAFLNFWDQGLMLLWAATAAALLVDDQAVRDFLEAARIRADELSG